MTYMMLEVYKCKIDEEFLKFKEALHKISYDVDQSDDMTDISKELYRLHLVDLYEELHVLMG